MTPATTNTRRRLFTELFTEALQQHCIIALHCNANNIEAALQQHCNATTTTTTTITTRRSVFTEALQQQHCYIALHCYCNNIEAALQQHCDATPTTTTTTSITISRLFLVLLFEALALRIVALALPSRDEALTVEALALALALRVQALALALALRVQALALALALRVQALLTSLILRHELYTSP